MTEVEKAKVMKIVEDTLIPILSPDFIAVIWNRLNEKLPEDE